MFMEAERAVRSDTPLASLGTHSNLLVVWRCATCRHEWAATASARARGGGCPKCAWKKRARARAQAPAGQSLLDRHPDVGEEFVRNLTRADMHPADLRPSSQQRCIWSCSTCGNRWEATVANRVAGRGCTACANRRRAENVRRPTERSGTAAEKASFPQSELIANLTDAARGLHDIKPGSTDRCLWRCSDCSHEWEATVVNRVLKCSGCPECAMRRAAEKRSTAPEDASLLALHPNIAAEFVANETAPGRSPALIRPGSNALCRWRCNRGHEWVTTVASRVAGAGCARCGARGQSRLELEVAELLRAATGEHVEVDVPLRAVGRSWRLDIAIQQVDLYIDLDPKFWHADSARDQRKADALREHHYVRVRHASLPDLTGVVTVSVTDGSLDAVTWAEALRPVVTGRGVGWLGLDSDTVVRALSKAADLWRQTLQGRPKRSALDVAPHLVDELLRNETRPGVELSWLPPSAKDRCWWRCQTCTHEWQTSVEVRAYLGSGCPACGRTRVGRSTSLAPAGGSLADLHPQIASEFVSSDRLDRTPSDLRPSTNIMCVWRCPECETEYRGSPAGRTRGRGCANCSSAKAGDARSRRGASDGNSLANRFPRLAGEFVVLHDHPHRTPSDIPPASNHRATWSCHDCGNEWSATVASRALGGHGCPACGRQRTVLARTTPTPGNTLADLHPAIAEQFLTNLTHPGRGADQLKAGSHDRCRWRCGAGHEWETTVKNRTRGGTGCPECYKTRRAQ
ncbi:zinc-ribbon domain-containing protein [Nocardioides carbamazepini]|nr:zinc-ribbon domain-containing protein [Nocardioides carbamazepini]